MIDMMRSVRRRAEEARLFFDALNGRGRFLLNGRDLYPIYSQLYDQKNERQFLKLLCSSAIKTKTGRLLKNLFKSKMLASGLNTEERPLEFDTSKIHDAAHDVANIFFGNAERYSSTRDLLADEESQHLFDLEILQRALASTKVFNSPYPELAVSTGLTDSMMRQYFDGSKLSDLPKLKGKSEVDFHIFCTFYMGQYEYKDKCTVHSGDTFFDCGACYGDTAVWALSKMAGKGTVVVFEPIKEFENIVKENISNRLPGAGINVLFENSAVSDKAGYTYFRNTGGSSKQYCHGESKVNLVKIDDFCANRAIYPDYIKMDIEGSELSALKGAEKIIREHKPRLAICVYHNPSKDLWEIPLFLKRCVPTYQFYLKKSTPSIETVLFAIS